MEISLIGWIHTILGTLAIIVAVFIIAAQGFIKSKNNLGKFYIIATLITASTALMLFKNGGFNLAHLLAILTIVAIILGITSEKYNIFTGEFWTGKTSLNLGLIDGIGNADQILKEKFGDKVIIKNFEKPKGFIARKLSTSMQDPVERLANIIEEKSMWQKFGL